MVPEAEHPTEDLVEPVDDEVQVDAPSGSSASRWLRCQTASRISGAARALKRSQTSVAVLAAFHAPGHPEEALQIETGGNGVRVVVGRADRSRETETCKPGGGTSSGRPRTRSRAQEEPIEAQFAGLLGPGGIVAVPDPELSRSAKASRIAS